LEVQIIVDENNVNWFNLFFVRSGSRIDVRNAENKRVRCKKVRLQRGTLLFLLMNIDARDDMSLLQYRTSTVSWKKTILKYRNIWRNTSKLKKVWIKWVILIISTTYIYFYVNCNISINEKKKKHLDYLFRLVLKAIQAVRIDFFVYIKSCQYSMFYTNKIFWTKSQV
jgi:hypothetical protein